jgi:hypothetical protein
LPATRSPYPIDFHRYFWKRKVTRPLAEAFAERISNPNSNLVDIHQMNGPTALL